MRGILGLVAVTLAQLRWPVPLPPMRCTTRSIWSSPDWLAHRAAGRS